eukprot:TRINITY_DN148_c1_g1_i1.p1 TRINITY_DN148_c1_g1~~TRINITY_DN148_c1_g1_i1.p1  ORF type:complete len:1052 (+),score=424.22 TRINITY_DN148_c1_g1_i1:61-3216(+)
MAAAAKPATGMEMLRTLQQLAAEGSQKLAKMAYDLKERLDTDEDFAEELIEAGAVPIVLDVCRETHGSVLAYLLTSLCSLLMFVKGVAVLRQQPEIVERIWALATTPSPQGGVNIKVARPALEILIVTVQYLGVEKDGADGDKWIHTPGGKAVESDEGRKIVHRAAKRLAREAEKRDDEAGTAPSAAAKPYGVLLALVQQRELHLLANVVLLLNLLLTKAKKMQPPSRGEHRAKKLLFLWEKCGLLEQVRSMDSEDPKLKKLLAGFQKGTRNVKIPQCWREVEQQRAEFMAAERAYQKVCEQVSRTGTMQSQARQVRAGVARRHENVRALALQLGLSPNYHPTRRWDDGGAIVIPKVGVADAAAEAMELRVPSVAEEQRLDEQRQQIFDRWRGGGDFMRMVEKVAGPLPKPPQQKEQQPQQPAQRKGRKGVADVDLDLDDIDDDDDDAPPDYDDDDDDDIGPPPDDDDDDIGPPPDDDMDDIPPPPDDAPDVGPPGSGGSPAAPAGVAGVGGVVGVGGVAGDGGVGGVGGDGTPGAGATAGGVPAGSASEAAVDGSAPPAAAVDAGAQPPAGVAADGAPAAAPGAPAAAAPAAPAAARAPPAPKPAGKKPGAKPAGKRGKVVEPKWFDHPAPKHKMKQMHWDKWVLPAECEGTMWWKVHKELGTILDFDRDQFETMYQMQERKKEKTGPKKEPRVEMMDGKKFQNISIMLTKQPKVPDMRKALDELDSDVLTRDHLEALKAALPTDDEAQMFRDKIPEKEKTDTPWDPPEQFWRMVIEYGTDIFRKRVEAWLFTQDWDEMMINIRRPLERLQKAVTSVTSCETLPYVCGVLLGFGNMMNCEHKQKSNAGAFAPRYLKDIEATKDQSGKLNLLQHLVQEVRHQNEEALRMTSELQPIHNNVAMIKYDELQKGFDDGNGALRKFGVQIKGVVAHLEKGRKPGDPPDSFEGRMNAFREKAEAELSELKERYDKLREDFMYLLKWWASPQKVCDKPQPEEFFQCLVPFAKRFGEEVDELRKREEADKKKKKKGGAKLGDKQMADLVNSIQEDLVS